MKGLHNENNKNYELLLNHSKKLGEMLVSAEDFDTILRIGDETNIRTFSAHSFMLRAVCPYFNKALNKDWAKKKNGMFLFEKQDVAPEVFEVILEFIYTGICNLESLENHQIIDIMITSDELMLTEFVEFIETYLIDKHSSWIISNFDQIVSVCFKYLTMMKLQEFCLKELCKDSKKIFTDANFKKMGEPLLVNLIKTDELSLDEVEIWEKVIEWGKFQVSNLRSINNATEQPSRPLDDDVSKWSLEDFESLRNVIANCIPHIRYNQIHPRDFHTKVKPYKLLLPSEQYEEILWLYVFNYENPPVPSTLPSSSMVHSPPRNGTIKSRIIGQRHAALIAAWICQVEMYHKPDRMTYVFDLRIRGTRDGFSHNTFKSVANHVEKTIVVARVKGSSEIIGGYNPYSWRHDRCVDFWRPESRTFIFSFPDGEPSEKAIFSKINPEHQERAMYIRKDGGPEFGDMDLYMSDQFNLNTGVRCRQRHYLEKIRESEESFAVDEYEMFQVKRRWV
ncbi:15496_t:CDS:2 [Acaulospora morrowiae]|uniref:15496_t:CDS:1 n=1 Tax=Acaulospora morrowiae TaxID=94023 RepID=A0A9N9I0T1_9GLOM|nr:15496_t:CDS:2 [Acaulospora morrowiae]